MNLAPQQLSQHLSSGLKPLYVLSGDEPLSQRECLDAIRAKARDLGFDERTSLTSDRYFNWAQIAEFGKAMSLFASQRLLEINIPTGKPGLDGSKVLQALAAEALPDTVTVVILPAVDWRDAKSAWYTALQQNSVFIELREVGPTQLPQWIASRLELQKQSTDTETLTFMANQVEGNLLAAHQEIQKLGLLYPAGAIAGEDVRAAVLDRGQAGQGGCAHLAPSIFSMEIVQQFFHRFMKLSHTVTTLFDEAQYRTPCGSLVPKFALPQ